MKTTEQNTMNDISAINVVERIIEMKFPNDKERDLGVRVTLKSINDPSMRGLKRKITNKRLDLDAKGKHFKADDIEENRDEIVFATMTGWDWYGCKFIDGSNNPAFNRKNVMDLFEAKPWFRDQLDEALNDEAAFFAVSNPA